MRGSIKNTGEIEGPMIGLQGTGFNPYFILILLLTVFMPLLVMPGILDNAFNTPKTIILVTGVAIMAGIYGFSILNGKKVIKSGYSIKNIILVLIILNLFSFLYTRNIYFTRTAAMLNIACLLFFYFVSLYINRNGSFVIIIASTISGVLVSIITWLQFFNVYILMRWASPGEMIMGTIGNSNYLGAYLIFPLFASGGLIFLIKGKLRLIPAGLFLFVLGAFIFARARSSWIGFLIALPLFIWILRRITGSVWLKPSRVILYLMTAILVIIVLWRWTPVTYKENRIPFRKVLEVSSLKYRFLGYIPPSIELWKQSPLFGTGLWSYRNMVYEAQARINSRTGHFFDDYPDPKPRRAHNEYLEILNDGGLVAGLSLLIFLIIVMRHGWNIIQDNRIDYKERLVAAICFCSTTAILMTAFFFFPFRVNSTMFMTVLFMGLMEGIYARNRERIYIKGGHRARSGPLLGLLIIFTLIGALWYAEVRPLKGEIEFFKYKKSLSMGNREAAENHLLKAINNDPQNSAYNLYASQLYMSFFQDYPKAEDFIERAITDFNGDVTMWSVYFFKGLIKYKTGNILDARAAFKKSLTYNPHFVPSQEWLREVKKVIEEHDGVTIKFR